MAKRKMNLKIWFFIYILVITAWLLGSVMQTGAQIQKTITGQNNPAVDPQAVQAAVSEDGTIDSKETFDFGEKGSVIITGDVNAVGGANSIIIRASASPKKGGSISPSGSVTAGYGEDMQFTVTPSTGYQIKDVIVDGVSQGAVNTYTFTNITQKHSIKAKFTKQTFSVAIAQGGKVSVSPVGTKTVTYGKKIKLKIKPESEDVVPILLVNGQQVDATKSGEIYEFDLTVVGNTSVYATSAVEPTIAPNVKVTDEATMQNVSSISQDGTVLTFNGITPYLESLQPGDVIISGVTDATPYGLLRKVTKITINGSQITVETTDATIKDVIEEGEIIINQELTASNITSFVPLVEGVTLQEETIPGPLATAQKCLSLHNVLYDHDGDPNTTYDQIALNGTVCLSAQFNFGLGIGLNWSWGIPYPTLKNFVLSTTLTDNIVMSLDSKYGLSFSKKIPVATIVFAPITAGPLVIVPTLTVYVGIDAGLATGITAGVTCTTNSALTLGLAYDGNNWTPISDFTFGSDVSETPYANAYAKSWVTAYAGPEFALMLYGVAGGFLNLQEYFGLELAPLSNPWLSVYAGIRAGAGVKAGIWGFDIEKEFGLLDYRVNILELSGNRPPIITSLTASPSSVYTGGASTVTAVVSDPENDPLTCSWTATGGTLSSTTGCGSVTWTAPGTPGGYSVSVSVTDNKEGHSPNTSGVTINVWTTYTLTVQNSGTGYGSVTGTGTYLPSFTCPTDCSEKTSSGARYTLTATPNSISTFTSWTGCDSTNGNTCTVTMDQDRTVIATFTINYNTLTVQKAGSGSGTVTSDPSGINCGSTCSENFAMDSQVTLTATPSSGSTFTSWTGCPYPIGNTCTVVMTQDKTVTAHFSLQYTLSVQKAGSGSGTVTSDPSGINCGSTCSENLADGTAVTLTATPSIYSSTFTSWTGCDSTNGNTCTVTMNQNKTVTATFGVQYYTLFVQKAGGGSGTVTSSPSGINCGSICSENNLTYETSITLTATPNSGSVFTDWSGCSSTNGNTCTVFMTKSKTVTAYFSLRYTLSVQKAGSGSGTVTGTGINCGSTCSEKLASGTTETLTATPNSGSGFTSWSGCDSTNGNTCTVTMNQNRTVTATFTPSISTYTLTVQSLGTGGGGGVILGSVGTNINCETDWSASICSESLPNGTIVDLSEQHYLNPASALTSWSGCDTTIGGGAAGCVCTVLMNQNRTVTATFTACAASTYTLTVNSVGPQNGGLPTGVVMGQTVEQGSGSTINCYTTNLPACSQSYTCGALVTLAAGPLSGFTFTGWSGCDFPNGIHCTVTMNQNKTVTATFTAQ